MADSDICRTVLLDDLPSDADAFGSHGPIADAIADMVRSEEGGKAVAIDGPWGSGKSTVVALLRNTLRAGDAQSSAQTLVFDAWSHRDDPLRRTFLEWLMDELGSLGWIVESDDPKNEWRKLRDTLSKRRQEQTIERTPGLRTLGWVMAVLYLLAPVGLGLFLKVSEIDSGWWPFVGLVLLLLPFVLTLASVIHQAAKKQPIAEAIALLVSKSTEIINSKTLQTPEPTSIEFQDFFSQIMRAALPREEPERRLVLVIDNLDRMCHDDSLAIWSTMRTFFDLPRSREYSWLRRFWLVVPYDHHSLVRLWDQGYDESVGCNAEGNSLDRTHGRNSSDIQTAGFGSDGSMAESFIQKTFQVRFQVPPPVLSDWGCLLERTLAAALPDHKADEIHDVYRLYAAYRAVTTAQIPSPTPRELKMLANDLGAVHRQWCQRGIPLVDQGLYVMLVRTIGQRRLIERLNDPVALIGGPGNAVLRIISNDWHRRLAAMAFNVPEDKAMQVLFGGQIEAHLPAGDADALCRHRDSDGFWQVCEQIVSERLEDWARDGGVQLAKAARAVSALGIGPNVGVIPDRVCHMLCTKARGVSEWDLSEPSVADGLIALYSMEPSRDLLKALAAGASSLRARGEAGAEPQPWPIDSWVEGALQFLRGTIALVTTAAEEILSAHFRVAAPADIYVLLMRRVSSLDNTADVARFLQPAVTTSEVVASIVADLDPAGAKPGCESLIPVLTAAMPDADWGPMVDGLNRLLVETGGTQPPVAGDAVGALLALEVVAPAARDTLRSLALQGFLLHWLHVTSGGPLHTARIAFAVLRDVQDFSKVQQRGNSPQGHARLKSILDDPEGAGEIVSALANLVAEHAALDLVFTLGVNEELSASLAGAVLRQIVHRERPFELLRPAVIVDRAPLLRVALGSGEFSAILERAVREADLRQELIRREFGAVAADLHREVLAIDGGSGEPEYHALLESGFAAISSEQWKQMLVEGDPTVLLLSDAVEKGIRTNLGTHLRDGVENYSTAVMNGNPNRPHKSIVPVFRDVLNGLSEADRRDLLSRMAKRLARHDGVIGPFLVLYGRFLLEDTKLLHVNPEHTIDVLFRHVLSEKGEAGIAWMTGVLARDPRLYRDRTESIRNDFENRLREARVAVSESSATLIDEMARSLGIDLDLLKAVETAQSDRPSDDSQDSA